MQWIYSSELSRYVDQLLDLNTPTVATFKSQMLMSASRLGLSDLVKTLITKGVDLNARDRYDTESLRYAIENDKYYIVALLLEAEAWPQSTDRAMEYSPLYLAIAQEHNLRIVELLIKHGADINTIPYGCCSLLREAVRERKHGLVEFLITAGADVNLDALDEQGSALQSAIWMKHTVSTQLKIKNGADVNYCITNFDFFTIPEEEDHDFGPDKDDKDMELEHLCYFHEYLTPIQIACLGRRPQLVELLSKAGVDVNLCLWENFINDTRRHGKSHHPAMATASKGKTCLQAAARGLHSDMVELLLQLGADPNGPMAEFSGLTALQMCFTAIVETRLDEEQLEGMFWYWRWARDQFPNQPRWDGDKWEEFFKILKALVDAGADVNAPSSSDLIISTAGLVALTQDRSTLQYLVEKGLELDGPSNRSSAIIEAVQLPDFELVNDLIRYNVDVNSPGRSLNSGVRPHTALAAAASRGNIKMVEILFAAGASSTVSHQNEVSHTPLGWAVHHRFVDLVKLLLERGANPNGPFLDEQQPGKPMSAILPLPFVLRYSSYDQDTIHAVVTMLLDAKADPKPPGKSLLATAVCYHYFKSAQKLIEAGADVHAPAHDDYYGHGMTAVQYAASNGRLDMYRLLRAHNADINTPPTKKREMTALQAAATYGHHEMVLTLLQDDAKVSAPPSEIEGRHALEGAAEHGRLDIVCLLLENDDEPSTFRRRCVEAADRAADNGRTVIANLLRARIAQDVWSAEEIQYNTQRSLNHG